MLAVGAAGVFAVRGMSDGAEGGAATPDELGAALMTAFENEDALGAVDVLLPGERDLLRQPMIDLVAQLARLEVLAPEADLGKIEGFDVVLENEAVVVESTNVPDIANLTMTADAAVTVDGSVFPIGDLVTDNMDPADVEDMRSTTETTDEPFDLEIDRGPARRALVLQPLLHRRRDGPATSTAPTSRSRASAQSVPTRPRRPSTRCSTASRHSTSDC